MIELAVDHVVLFAAKLVVPPRQSVFDLAVRTQILLEDRAENAVFGEDRGGLGARCGAADNRDGMARSLQIGGGHEGPNH